MNIYLKSAYSMFLKLLLANVLCILISVSVTTLFSVIFSDEIGYEAKGYIASETTENSTQTVEKETLYTYYYKDGEDTKKAEYEAQGYTITEYLIYSDISSGGRAASLIVTQSLCLFMLAGFIYVMIWPIGFKDGFAKNPSKDQMDKLKGFKVGLLSVTPYYLFLIILCIFKNSLTKNFSVGIFKIINSTLYSFIDIISNGVVRWGNLEIWQMLLLFVVLLIIPLICQVWYSIGRHGIVVSKKIMYKKNIKRS